MASRIMRKPVFRSALGSLVMMFFSSALNADHYENHHGTVSGELRESASRQWKPDELNVPGLGSFKFIASAEGFARYVGAGKAYLAYLPKRYFLSAQEKARMDSVALALELPKTAWWFISSGFYHGHLRNGLVDFEKIKPIAPPKDPSVPYVYTENFTSIEKPHKKWNAEMRAVFYSVIWKKYYEHQIAKEYYLSCYESEAECDDYVVSPVVVDHWKAKEGAQLRLQRQKNHREFIEWFEKNNSTAVE